MREWFSSYELAGLPGLPQKANSIARKAKEKHWKSRRRSGVQGTAYEFHYTNFPLETQAHLGLIQARLTPSSSVSELMVQEPSSEYQTENLILIPEFEGKNEKSCIYLPISYISKFVFSASNLRVWMVNTDSMQPIISSMERVLLDTAFSFDKELYSGIYLAEVKAGKNLVRLEYCIQKEGYYLKYDNSNCNNEFIKLDEFYDKVTLLGKVVCVLFRPVSFWSASIVEKK